MLSQRKLRASSTEPASLDKNVEESGTYKPSLYLYVGHSVATNNALQHPLSNSFDSSKLQGLVAASDSDDCRLIQYIRYIHADVCVIRL